MAKSFDLESRNVPPVETKNRKICTAIPTQDAIDTVTKLRKYEPRSMSGQPLVVWDRGEGFNVMDKHGNKWIDFSSGVLVVNAGHNNPEIKKAVIDMAEHGLLHNYVFPSEIRATLVERLVEITPDEVEKAFLLTTGAESTECAIKLARTYGAKVGGNNKLKIVTFTDDFHGRTMGAQMAGGSPGGKAWIVNLDKDMVQVPYPNAFKYEWADESRDDYSDENCFNVWMSYLTEAGVKPEQIAGIMPESFQGGWVQLMPKGFAKKLREMCDKNDILLIFDEVQAGFGRSGKLFTYQHYDIKADLICCGKGISSSLPLSAVLGRKDVLDLYGPNEMTSTHTGNPVCSAAALASINYILKNNLIDNAAKLSKVCEEYLVPMQEKHANRVGALNGVGLAWGIVFTQSNSKEIDPDFAHDVAKLCIERGVLLFAPVGAGATLKICPPLMITEEALREGLEVFIKAVDDVAEGNI